MMLYKLREASPRRSLSYYVIETSPIISCQGRGCFSRCRGNTCKYPPSIRPLRRSSQTMMLLGCICRAVIVHIWEMPPSTPCCKALALLCPLTMIRTFRADMIVPTPTVRAVLGTRWVSPPKKRELAIIVSWVSVFTRVRDVNEDPGR